VGVPFPKKVLLKIGVRWYAKGNQGEWCRNKLVYFYIWAAKHCTKCKGNPYVKKAC